MNVATKAGKGMAQTRKIQTSKAVDLNYSQRFMSKKIAAAYGTFCVSVCIQLVGAEVP
jgi:hypothetical protein